MYCRKCGNQLEEDALFCSKCGTKIEDIKVVKTEINSKAEGIKKENEIPIKNIVNKKTIGILALVLVFIIAIIGLSRGINKPKTNDEITLEELCEEYERYVDENLGDVLTNDMLYYLVYVNNDNVPELIIDTDTTKNDGYKFISYNSGEFITEHLRKGQVGYVEKGNIIHISSEDLGGTFFDRIYKMTENELIREHIGHYIVANNEVIRCNWNEQDLSVEEYIDTFDKYVGKEVIYLADWFGSVTIEEAFNTLKGIEPESKETVEDSNANEDNNIQQIDIQLEELLAAYNGYLDKNGYYSNNYCFIYLNNDNVPELLLYDGLGGASLNMLLSYSNGEVTGTQLNEGSISYNEYKNSLYVSGGRQGFYPETIYSLENGIANIVYETHYSEEIDFENQTSRYVYYIGEEEVSEEEYYDKLYSFIDKKIMRNVAEPYAKSTIESAYDVLVNGITGEYSMSCYRISNFELIDNRLYMSAFGNMGTAETYISSVDFELSDNCEWNRRYIDGTVEEGLTYEEAKEEIDYTYNNYMNDPQGYITDSATVYGIKVMNNKIVEIYSFNS